MSYMIPGYDETVVGDHLAISYGSSYEVQLKCGLYPASAFRDGQRDSDVLAYLSVDLNGAFLTRLHPIIEVSLFFDAGSEDGKFVESERMGFTRYGSVAEVIAAVCDDAGLAEAITRKDLKAVDERLDDLATSGLSDEQIGQVIDKIHGYGHGFKGASPEELEQLMADVKAVTSLPAWRDDNCSYPWRHYESVRGLVAALTDPSTTWDGMVQVARDILADAKTIDDGGVPDMARRA